MRRDRGPFGGTSEAVSIAAREAEDCNRSRSRCKEHGGVRFQPRTQMKPRAH